eukprot:GHVL01008414.1.p2 GENE.GHVL01008414.1~~GHVL01008414.1.p2  ORF type:complete len:259 (+),score=40.98 GHVL01008414.1:39-815(+)
MSDPTSGLDKSLDDLIPDRTFNKSKFKRGQFVRSQPYPYIKKPLQRSEASDCVVYLSNVPWDCRHAMVSRHMQSAGDVVNVFIPMIDGDSSGTAEVTYKSPDEAANAIAELHNSVLNGRTLVVRNTPPPNFLEAIRADKGEDVPRFPNKAPSRGPNRPMLKKQDDNDAWRREVHVANLPTSVSLQEIEQAFSESAGPVEFADTLQDSKGRDYRMCIIRFKSEGAAQEAIRTYNGGILNDRRISVKGVPYREPDFFATK